MKKIISCLLAVVLLVSAVPMVYAADVDYTNGTTVTYAGTGTEAYTVTVPAKLAPGASGTVTLEGTWASNRQVTVSADANVVLTNSINAQDTKTLVVTFGGITLAGDNNVAVEDTEAVSVADISDALFGTWSGHFYYNVETFIYDDSFPFQWNSKVVSESNNPKVLFGEVPFVKISNLTPSVDSISNPIGSIDNLSISMEVLFSVDGMVIYQNTWGEARPLVIVYTPGEYEYGGQMFIVEETGTYFIDIYSAYDMNFDCTFKNT